MQKAAAEGDIARLRKTSVPEATQQEIAKAQVAWPFAAEGEERYVKGGFAAEIIEAARLQGLQVQRRDEGLVVFPSIAVSCRACVQTDWPAC